MARQARELQSNGRLVVFTNGCFDLLHMGHVRYLNQAASLGTLFVGVNSDDSVRKLKGRERPFNNQTDRAGVVAALEDVDRVSIFEEDTAVRIVERVRPDIYVKGGDYSSDPSSPKYPIEGHVVSRYGGTVRILPFSESYSTTDLIRRVRAAGVPA